MSLRRKYSAILLILFSSCIYGNDLISDTLTLTQIREGLNQVYNYDFDKAEQIQDSLQKKYPLHPVTSFYSGLISYWKNYPLVMGSQASMEFEESMKESWQRAEKLKEQEAELEGVFFDLMARSFIIMHYSDNGNPSKSLSHLGTIYRDIMKGFEMQEDFREFLFITGLYNYYREAYPEAYPVYKPALMFFRKGNREEGLKMMKIAAGESGFVGVEASLFLTLIYMNFENNPDSALRYALDLHQRFPENYFFRSKYAEMLLEGGNYDLALVQIRHLMELNNYSRMVGSIFMGIYEEKNRKDFESARRYYETGLRLAEPFGERVNYSRAYAYVGLSRYYALKEDQRKAREYMKKAKNASGYAYVFD